MTEQCKHEWRIEQSKNGPSYYCMECRLCSEQMKWNQVEARLNATERLKEYAVLLDRWFDADELPLGVTRAIGAARANCANILEGK